MTANDAEKVFQVPRRKREKGLLRPTDTLTASHSRGAIPTMFSSRPEFHLPIPFSLVQIYGIFRGNTTIPATIFGEMPVLHSQAVRDIVCTKQLSRTSLRASHSDQNLKTESLSASCHCGLGAPSLARRPTLTSRCLLLRLCPELNLMSTKRALRILSRYVPR